MQIWQNVNSCQALSDGNTDAYIFSVFENVHNSKSKQNTQTQQRPRVGSG